MGIFRRGLPLIRRVGEALLARGQFIPADPVAGTPEVVEPKGILRSKAVGFGLLGAIVSAIQIYQIIQAPTIDAEALQLAGGAFIGSCGAIWGRIVAWMPTRGPTVGSPE